MIRIGADDSPLRRSLANLRGYVQNQADMMSHIMAGLFGGLVIDKAMEAEQALLGIKAVLAATYHDAEELHSVMAMIDREILQIGTTTLHSSIEAGNALKEFVQLGFDAEEALSAVPSVLNLASAGGLDMASAARFMGQSMRQFAVDATGAAHVADVLAAGASRTATDIRTLATALSYVGTAASNLGFSLEETVAGLGVLHDAGIRGTRAGTGLNAVLADLAKADRRGILKRLGIQIEDADGRMKSLADIVDMLNDRFAGLSKWDRQQALGEIFDRRGATAAVSLMARGGDAIRLLTGEFKESSGYAERMRHIMEEGLSGSFRRFKAAAVTAMADVGRRLELLKLSFTGVAGLAAGFVNLSDDMKDMSAAVLQVVGGLVAMRLVVPRLIGLFALLTGALTAPFTMAYSLVTSLVGAVVRFATLAAAAFANVVSGVLSFGLALARGLAVTVWNTFLGVLGAFGKFFTSVFQSVIDLVRQFAGAILSAFGSIVQGAISAVVGLIGGLVTAVISLGAAMLNTGILTGILTGAVTLLKFALGALAGVLALSLVGSVLAFAAGLTGALREANGLAGPTRQALQDILDVLKEIAAQVFGWVDFETMWSDLKFSAYQTLLGIHGWLERNKQAIIETGQAIVRWVVGAMRVMGDVWTWVMLRAREAWGYITTKIEENRARLIQFRDTMSRTFNQLWDNIKRGVALLVRYVGGAFAALGGNVEMTWADVLEGVEKFFDKVAYWTNDLELSFKRLSVEIELAFTRAWERVGAAVVGEWKAAMARVKHEAALTAVAGLERLITPGFGIFTGRIRLRTEEGDEEEIQATMNRLRREARESWAPKGGSPAVKALTDQSERLRTEMERLHTLRTGQAAAREKEAADAMAAANALAQQGEAVAGLTNAEALLGAVRGANRKMQADEEDRDQDREVTRKIEFVGIADLHRKIQESLQPPTSQEARENRNAKNLDRIAAGVDRLNNRAPVAIVAGGPAAYQ